MKLSLEKYLACAPGFLENRFIHTIGVSDLGDLLENPKINIGFSEDLSVARENKIIAKFERCVGGRPKRRKKGVLDESAVDNLVIDYTSHVVNYSLISGEASVASILPEIQSGASIGNFQWATKGTLSGIVKVKVDGTWSRKKYALSLEHVMVGDRGKEGNDVCCPSIKDSLFAGLDSGKFGIVTSYYPRMDEPKGIEEVEWALAKIEDTDRIDNKVLGLDVRPTFATPKDVEIGMFVVKYGAGSQKTFGKVSEIHVFAQVGGGYLYGFKIKPVDENGDESHKPFAKSGDSGSLVLFADDKNDPLEPTGKVLGVLSMSLDTIDEQEVAYALYFHRVHDSIIHRFKDEGESIEGLKFI